LFVYESFDCKGTVTLFQDKKNGHLKTNSNHKKKRPSTNAESRF